MPYTIEYIAGALKDVRQAQGLTQRALGRKAGVPQSHISKIENGAVDLRLSSLVELARALHLELMLVPRTAVPVVQSIIRGDAGEPVRPAYSLDDDADGRGRRPGHSASRLASRHDDPRQR